MRIFSLAHWVVLGVSCFCLAACVHAGEPAGSVVVVSRAPRCTEIGFVEGVGGGPDTAIAEAKRRAAEKGATHAVLGRPDHDLDDGPTTVVRATLFECPAPGTNFPPTGYP